MLLHAFKIHLLDFTLSGGGQGGHLGTMPLTPQHIKSMEELFVYIITGFINCSNVKLFSQFVTNVRHNR